MIENEPAPHPSDRRPRGVVVTISPGDAYDAQQHESVTRSEIAKRLALIKGYDFAGEFERTTRYSGDVYFVPSQAIVGIAAASALGIRNSHDLFGAVVPHAFVATKTITHPLFDASARAPHGWSSSFCDDVRDAVLHGYSAFSAHDARRAGISMLGRGPLRLKVGMGVGGAGQFVVSQASELDEVLDRLGEEALAKDGVVLEEELGDVTTYSVGQVEVADIVITYFGTQHLTVNNRGHSVYGGSALHVVRGDFDALLGLGPSDDVRTVIGLARAYNDAAVRHFGGFFGSRRNYDVALGIDATGARRFGVLEQSWRIGGASGAEVGALEMFQNNPNLEAVQSTCFEIYGDDNAAVPSNATVYFRGVDRHVGPLIKYTVVERDGNTR